MLRLLHRLDAHLAAGLHPGRLDIRELILQCESTTPVHASAGRPAPSRLAALYTLDETLTSPPPRALALFDDILTTGALFKAAQCLLHRRFPGVPITGLFLARTSASPRPGSPAEDRLKTSPATG